MGKPWSKRNAERRKKQFSYENRQKKESMHSDRLEYEDEHVKVSRKKKKPTKKPTLKLVLDDQE